MNLVACINKGKYSIGGAFVKVSCKMSVAQQTEEAIACSALILVYAVVRLSRQGMSLHFPVTLLQTS